MSHKDKMRIKKKEVKVRRTWAIDPVTRIKQSDKVYNRAKVKKQFRYECEG